jgi:ABC-2 type transport system ATP-binding protein
MLAGMIAPTTGRAWIGGTELSGSADAVRSQVGLLTEAPGLYERMSAARNLDFHGRLQGMPSAHRRERVKACLDLVGLGDRHDDLVAGFSKGMKQKLAIARAVLHEPAAVFLDEPTSGLDPEAARDVRDFIRDLRDAGRAIFLCTHNLDEARRLCDRVAIFRSRILRLGSPRELEREVVQRRLAVRVIGPPERFLNTVQRLEVVRGVAAQDGELVVVLDELERDTPLVVRTLVEAGAGVQRVAALDSGLEAAYLSIIGEQPSLTAATTNGTQAAAGEVRT